MGFNGPYCRWFDDCAVTAEANFGSALMIIATMGMIFLGGVGLKRFFTIALCCITCGF